MTKGYEFMFILLFTAIVGLKGNEHPSTPRRPIEVSSSDKARALFSPRLEYNEWMPVGRGDPLKNDPTFDYSPPVLDQVRYWAENNSNKDKNDILLLGVPSKKTTTKSNKEAKYGPIRRTFFTQDLPTRLMPPPMHAQHSSQQIQYNWSHRKGVHADSQAESNSGFAVNLQRPSIPSHNQQGFKIHQTGSFSDPSMFNRPHFEQHPTTTTTLATTINYQTTKTPRRHSLKQALQAEAAPFSIQPSNVVKEYSLSYYNPQVINSMEFHRSPSSTTSEAPTTVKYVQSTTPPATFLPTVLPTTVTENVNPTTTGAPSMTTDSLFSHYRQPNQPLRGPMYLIIQGHSKVKTYGLKNNGTDKHLPKIVPVRINPVVQHVVNIDETGTEMTVPHVYTEPTKKLKDTEPSAMESLLSLLDTSFGNLLVEEEPESGDDQTNSLDSEKTSNFETRNLQQSAPVPTTITTVIERSTQARAPRRQRSADTRETVLSSSYQVGEMRPYRKGIVVSEARPERVKLKTTRR